MRFCLVVGLAVVMAGPVLAQEQGQRRGRGGRGGFGGGMFGPGMLLNQKSVHEELKMTEEQVNKAKSAIEEINKKRAADFQGLRGNDPENQEKRQALMKEIREETDKALAGILNEDQRKRLKQIELQFQGARAFGTPDVQKALNLTDDQKEKIKTINDDARQEMQSIFQGGGDPQENRKKMQALQKETTEKIVALLDEGQKKTWKEMTGAHFEGKIEFQQRGRRGQQ
jgi:hypothetical protein